ncbi:acetyl-CoA synthetase-like protein [Gigaspora margarita]|uniref:Acetyl-CoA synthetase-like protein n=1 Tax=Gigaspora margarita TaxID=4874 RepID=A0A8H3XMW6_GIGMA|nr:acetyl-CoA synthetase-like protein [Gigaspora margarita]
MIFKSNHPDIEIPQDGIFQYVMSNQKGISDNKIIYLDGNTSKGYTFGKLKSESKRFAAGLRDKVGFKPGDVLAIYSPNQVDYPMVLLGTIAAGGKVTPVDPKYVASELSYQLLDSGASILIVHPDLLEIAIAASKGINNPNLGYFYLGATLIIFPSYNIETFCRCIQKYKIDYIHAAPPVILDLINYSDAKKYDLSSVKIIVSAGAPLGFELEYMFYELFKIRIKQAYGLSEALFVHYSDSNNIITGSCGILLPNIKVKILSNDGHELGTKEPGELCVHGPSIMKGYLNNPSAMNAAFDNDGFLHTGDIAYVDGQGFILIFDYISN